MLLNDAGIMVEKWYIALERKFPYIQCHEMIIMPNHIHFIIENTGMVGANQRVCPPKPNQRVGPEEIIKPKHLGSIIQWFKTMSTNEYIRGVKNLGWPPFYKKLWQRNYWEHIIRNEQAFDRISNYIRTNPDKWDTGF
jgi:REP element-mobilizing transposase RayT